MTSHHLFITVALSAVVVLAACDAHLPPSHTAYVAIDVRPLFRPPGGSEEIACASVVDRLDLTVTGGDRRTTRYQETLTLEETVLRIPVTTVEGEARFAATIVSVNSTPLYTGEAMAVAEEGFTVSVLLDKRAPVLQVCPTDITLDANRGGAVTLYNRGAGTLAWEALPPPGCSLRSCLAFDDATGRLAAGASDVVFITAEPLFRRGQAEFRTAAGSVRIDVRAL